MVHIVVARAALGHLLESCTTMAVLETRSVAISKEFAEALLRLGVSLGLSDVRTAYH